MIKVLLIEDHDIVREGTEQLLARQKGFSVIGSTSTGKDGLQLAREKSPDITVLDFQLPDINGLEVAHKLLQYNPDMKILILTAHASEDLAIKLLEAGVAGYLSKECSYNELDRAIRTIHHGQRYISSDMASKLALRRTSPTGKSAFDELSTREMEVALLIANGLDVEAIANRLHLSKKTVHSYRYRIFGKLGIQSDLELLRLSLKHKIVELDPDGKLDS